MTVTVARLLDPGEKPALAVARAKASPVVGDWDRPVNVRHLDGYTFTPSPDGKRWGGRVEWEAEIIE